MKSTLDFGTMVSNDPARLRAFKEQVKMLFKGRWLELAEILESYDLIIRCSCEVGEFCQQCGGARYLLDTVVTPEEIAEITTIITDPSNDLVMKKLREALP